MLDGSKTEATAPRRYWVVGGDYESMAFDRLVQGTAAAFGPFECREDAETLWRGLSQETRSRATVRFTIASETR